MTVISILGTSGVGKSFLVRQLAALDCMPCFLEGEEGVFPEGILENVFDGGDPSGRYEYFLSRHEKNCVRARIISEKDLDVFLDGDFIHAANILETENSDHKEKFIHIIEQKIKQCASDIVILLHAEKTYVERFIMQRGRESEDNTQAIQRAMKVQEGLISRLKNSSCAILIDRTQLDFSKRQDLLKVKELITKKKIELQMS